MSVKLAVMRGDGIGPEITSATLRAVEALDARFGLGLQLSEYEIGLPAIASRGISVPDEVREACRAADGIILGPVDTYAYPPASQGGVNPSALFRKSLDLYANIRPSRVRPGCPAPAKAMDLVVVRENTEGFYADRNMFTGAGEFMPTEDVALAVRKITRAGSLRIARQAFELARTRRRKVTVVHKANVLKVSDGLFLDCVNVVAEDYPDIELDEVLIDAMTAHLIRTPDRFDVVLTTNMYGDILSDEAAELSGGLGLGGSVNAGDDHGVAQAAHGSAPDIAGQGIANPTALMVSVALLFQWLGNRGHDHKLIEAAAALEAAVDKTLGDASARTPDLGGSGSTEGFGEAVAGNI